MSERTIKTGVLHRTFEVRAPSEGSDVVELSFSSEAPVDRWFGREILDHNPKSVRLDRIRNAGPLLFNHDPDRHIGRVESVEIDAAGKVGRARVRFSNSSLGREKLQDIRDGILREVSVGYEIHKMVREGEDGEVETLRATDWEPLEISLVTVPADTGVGVGRSADKRTTDTTIIIPETRKNMSDTTSTSGADEQPKAVETRSEGGSQNVVIKYEPDPAAKDKERKRVSEIYALAREYNVPDAEVRKAVDGDTSPDQFCRVCLQAAANTPPERNSPNLGLSEKEKRSYSIVKAVRSIVFGGGLDGLEKEASDAQAEKLGRSPDGFFLPSDVVYGSDSRIAAALAGNRGGKRALTAESAGTGGYLVGTDVLTGSLIELLRNRLTVNDLGATSLTGLTGNVAIPTVEGGATGYWLGENESVTASNQTFGQLSLVPHRLAADTAFSKQLVTQTSISVEAFVRDDIMRVLAIAKDLACLNGSGAGGEPLGIINTSGISTENVTNGDPTYAEVLLMEADIETSNALMGSLGWVTTPAMKAAMRANVVDSGSGRFVWEGGTPGDIIGYPAYATAQMPASNLLFGNWSDLIVADWDGVDVVVDPYSLKKTNQIEITVSMNTDCAIRHPASFTLGT